MHVMRSRLTLIASLFAEILQLFETSLSGSVPTEVGRLSLLRKIMWHAFMCDDLHSQLI